MSTDLLDILLLTRNYFWRYTVGMETSGIGEDVLTVTQAAKEAGVTQAAIRNAIYEGKLAARQLLGRQLITRADLDAYLATRRPRGRPRKQQE